MMSRARGSDMPLIIFRLRSITWGIGIARIEKKMPSNAEHTTGFPRTFLMKNLGLFPPCVSLLNH